MRIFDWELCDFNFCCWEVALLWEKRDVLIGKLIEALKWLASGSLCIRGLVAGRSSLVERDY